MKTIETLDPKAFRGLITTIGELPSSFVDSMSYYEMIAWLVDYIKSKVIPAVNNNAEAIKEIQKWIETLDLQDEVNNKLDEMAASGQLAEIISQYLNSTAIFGFDTVADMKNAENLINGSYARTVGYYSKNDGGGALYRIRNVTNDDVIDESFLIEITGDVQNNLVAELIVDTPKYYNVLKLGIKRNTNEAQDEKLASIIEDLTNGDTLFFPNGEYKFTQSIVLKNRINIEGVPLSTGEKDTTFNGSRLSFSISETPESAYPLIDCSLNNKTLIKNIYVLSDSYEISCDRTLQSTTSTPVDTFTTTTNTPYIVGIKLYNYGSELDNVIVRGCSRYGVNAGKYNLLNNVRVYNCSVAFNIENDNTMNDCNCFTCLTGITVNGPINLINNFRADEVKRGIWCYEGSNNIKNLFVDYALYCAVQFEGSNNNYISGTLGRVGTYFAEAGSNDATQGCYIANIGSNFNRVDINISKRNTTDSGDAIYNPCFTIATKNTCTGNLYTLTGENKNLSYTSEKLTKNELKNLLTVVSGSCSDTVMYYGYNYVFNGTTSSYSNDSISISNYLHTYANSEIYNKIINAGSSTSITFTIGTESNQTFLVMVAKNGTSERGLYLLGYSTATATLVKTDIKAIDGVTISKSGSTITISGVTNYSTASILSVNKFA